MAKPETYAEREERQRLGNLEAFENGNFQLWLEAVAEASGESLTPPDILSALHLSFFEGLVVAYEGCTAEGERIENPQSWRDVRRISQAKGYAYSLFRGTKGQTPTEQAFRMWYLDFIKNKGKAAQLKARAFFLVWTLEVFDGR